jgi:hypothetical protein
MWSLGVLQVILVHGLFEFDSQLTAQAWAQIVFRTIYDNKDNDDPKSSTQGVLKELPPNLDGKNQDVVTVN